MNNTQHIRIPLKPGSKSAINFDECSVSCEGTTLRYDEIVGITFYSGKYDGVISNSAGVIILRSFSDRLKITIRNFSILGYLDTGKVSNYFAICQEVMKRIAPFVLTRLGSKVVNGHAITIGSFTLESSGITFSGMLGTRRRATWNLRPEVRNMVKRPWYNQATHSGILEVSYFYPPTGKMVTVGSVTSRDENGCLLPHLLNFFSTNYQ